jgi:signal peptidase I
MTESSYSSAKPPSGAAAAESGARIPNEAMVQPPVDITAESSSERQTHANANSGRELLREIVETVALFAFIFTIARVTIGNYAIIGQSMEPNYRQDERLLVDRISPRLSWLQRGDIVIVHSPDGDGQELIKRLIGKPGDVIELRDNKVWVNGTALAEPYLRADADSSPRGGVGGASSRWELGEDQYFIMGDNRTHSRDSRSFGPVDRDRVAGRALLVYYPFADFQLVQHHAYDGVTE